MHTTPLLYKWFILNCSEMCALHSHMNAIIPHRAKGKWVLMGCWLWLDVANKWQCHSGMNSVHKIDDTWALWRLKLPATRLFSDDFFGATKKKASKRRITGPLGSVDSPHKWTVIRKETPCHAMIILPSERYFCILNLSLMDLALLYCMVEQSWV